MSTKKRRGGAANGSSASPDTPTSGALDSDGKQSSDDLRRESSFLGSSRGVLLGLLAGAVVGVAATWSVLIRDKQMDSSPAAQMKAEVDRLEKQVSDCATKSARLQKDKLAADNELSKLREHGREDDKNRKRVAELSKELEQSEARIGQLHRERAEFDIKYDAANARVVKLEEELAGSCQSQGSDAVRRDVASLPWPGCIMRSNSEPHASWVLTSLDIRAYLGDAAPASHGNFEAREAAECAHMCAVVDADGHKCEAWMWKESGASKSCHLFAGPIESLKETPDGKYSYGMRSCAPDKLPEVPPARAAIAILESEELKACDNGGICRSLSDALRTWRYGITMAREALKGTEFTSSMEGYLNQIDADASSLLDMGLSEGQHSETYDHVAANNRQVFQAIYGVLKKKRERGGNQSLECCISASCAWLGLSRRRL